MNLRHSILPAGAIVASLRTEIRHRARTLILLLGAIFVSLSAHAQPMPNHIVPGQGSCLITAQTTLYCTEPSLEPLVDYLREHIDIYRVVIEHKSLSRVRPIPSEAQVGALLPAGSAIVLALDPTLETEGYRLDVAPVRITVTGGAYGGVFNGVQTLLRMMPAEVYAGTCPLPIEVACVQVEDAPRFAYRGMMLDVARTWIEPSQVKRYINLLAYHNINKLHLHLTDDEGWRIEIRSHPELTEIGGFRGKDSPVRAVYGKWDEKYGGYFTQEQLRELIDYAAVRNIEIIPEIDLPGHSRNIAAVHPEIRCDFPPDTLSTNGYDYRSVWCAAREENYVLLAEIIGEVCELFPSEYIHIGGDEVDFAQWEHCPECRKLMREQKIPDTRHLEEYFLGRVTEMLAAHGKRPAVWNEMAAGGRFTRESRVYGWESVKACKESAAKGYPTVVMPGDYFYFDMRQSLHEDGHEWAAIFDARKVFEFDLVAQGFTPKQLRHVVGFEGAFFSELYVSHTPEKPDYLDYMTFPRICALARIAWGRSDERTSAAKEATGANERTDNGGRWAQMEAADDAGVGKARAEVGESRGTNGSDPWADYYDELVGRHYDRMVAMGIRFRLFPPRVTYRDGVLEAMANDGAQLWYVVDEVEVGARASVAVAPRIWSIEPLPREQRYTAPIATDRPHLYRFFTRHKTARSPDVADRSYYRTITPAMKVSTSMGVSEQFPLTGVAQYKGFARTTRACRLEDWILYSFDAPVRCRELFLQTGHRHLPKTIVTTGYVEISYDGVRFERAGELFQGSLTLRPERALRAMRIVSTARDNGTPFVTILPPVIKPVF